MRLTNAQTAWGRDWESSCCKGIACCFSLYLHDCLFKWYMKRGGGECCSVCKEGWRCRRKTEQYLIKVDCFLHEKCFTSTVPIWHDCTFIKSGNLWKHTTACDIHKNTNTRSFLCLLCLDVSRQVGILLYPLYPHQRKPTPQKKHQFDQIRSPDWDIHNTTVLCCIPWYGSDSKKLDPSLPLMYHSVTQAFTCKIRSAPFKSTPWN